MNIDTLIERAGKLTMPNELRLTDDEIEKIAQELEAAIDIPVESVTTEVVKTPVEDITEILKVAEEKALDEARFNIKVLKALNEDGFIDKLAQFKIKALENNSPPEDVETFIKEAALGKAWGWGKGLGKSLGREWAWTKHVWAADSAGTKALNRDQYWANVKKTKIDALRAAKREATRIEEEKNSKLLAKTGKGIKKIVDKYPVASALGGITAGAGVGYGIHKGLEKAEEWQKNLSATPEPYTQGYHPYYG